MPRSTATCGGPRPRGTSFLPPRRAPHPPRTALPRAGAHPLRGKGLPAVFPGFFPRSRRRHGLFVLTLLQATNTVEPITARNGPTPPRETVIVTKKEIVKKISEDIGLTQLKTKDIVQRT